MDALHALWTSLFSLLALFILTKLMGNRQISQLSIFDYVISISIGSIAAEMASNLEDNVVPSLVAMSVYALVTVAINWITQNSLKLRGLLLGKPTVLYENGTLYYLNLQKAKLDLSEFLTECRTQGYFDLSQLSLVVMETNGRMSFLPCEAQRPLTPSDMNLHKDDTRPAIPVLMDGAVLHKGLSLVGKDENWLDKQLEKQGFTAKEDIFLAVVSGEDQLSLYEKNEDKVARPYYR